MEFMETNHIAHQELIRALQKVTEEKEEWVSLRKLYSEVNSVFKLRKEWVDGELKGLEVNGHLKKDFNAIEGTLILWKSKGS